MHIRYLLIAICASLFIAWSLSAAESDETTYWVLGSYDDATEAFQERDRVESATGIMIYVIPAEVDGVQRYRLLAKTAESVANRELQQMNLGFYGITDVWTLNLVEPIADVEMLDSDIAAAGEEIAEEPPASETATAAYWVLSGHPDLQQAISERDRVEIATGMMVFVIPGVMDDIQHYRLVVKAADSSANRDLQQLNLSFYGVTDIWLLDLQGPIEAIEIAETAIAAVPQETPPVEPGPAEPVMVPVEPVMVPAEPVMVPAEPAVAISEEIPAPVEEEITRVEAEVPTSVAKDVLVEEVEEVEEVVSSAADEIPIQAEEQITGIQISVPAPVIEEEIITAAADIPSPIFEEISSIERVVLIPLIEEEIAIAQADIPIPVIEETTGTEAVTPVPVVEEEIAVVATVAAEIPIPVEEEVTPVEDVIPAPVVEEEVAIVEAEIPAPPVEEEITRIEEEIPPAPVAEVAVVTPVEEIPEAGSEKALAATYVQVAMNLFEQRQYSEAVVNYSRAITLDPENERIYNHRGLAYKKLRKYDQAIDDYSRAISINKDYTQAYTNRGITYRKLGEFDRATNDYKQAIKLDPKNVKAYYSRSKIFFFQIFPVLAILLAA